MESSGTSISCAQAPEMEVREAGQPDALARRPPIAASRSGRYADGSGAFFHRVFVELVDRLPGEPWARTAAMKSRLGIEW